MSAFDKIAILWIDDIPESGHPERGLGVYDRFFEVVCKDDADNNDSLKSIEDFNQLLKDYLSPNAKASVFPVELVAVDYDLSTYNPSGQMAGQLDVVDASDADEGQAIDDSSRSGAQVTAAETVDFDGFLIGSIYAAHFRLHPVGMVATTYQSKRMGTTVRQLENTLMMCYDVDIDFAGKKRTWKNILEAGVRRLRSRIERLYGDGHIVVSTRDLLALADDPDHEMLTIQSRFGVRRLPVQGLFIDVSEGNRTDAIQAWANELLSHVVSREDIREAEELADAVWTAYNDDELVQKRERLSAMLADGAECEELDELKKFFDTSATACRDRCCTLFSGNYSSQVRRWAALLIVLRLLRRIILAKKAFEGHIREAVGGDSSVSDIDTPVLTADDVYLALFPVTAKPLVLKWHRGRRINREDGWASALLRLKDKSLPVSINGDNPGNLALHIPDLLGGDGWRDAEEGGRYGLHPAERRVLQGFALADDQLSMSDWRSHTRSRMVLFGNEDEEVQT